MAWERVIVQDGAEIVVGEGTEKEATDWLAFKRSAHQAAGWTIVGVDPLTFEASRTTKDGFVSPKTRRFFVRSVL